MLISYKLIVYTLLFILAIILLSIYFKRNQRKYTPRLKKQVVDLTDRTIDHLEKAKKTNDPFVSLQEASYAFGLWDSVKTIVTEEDLPFLVDIDVDDLNKQIKYQMQQSLDKLEKINYQ